MRTGVVKLRLVLASLLLLACDDDAPPPGGSDAGPILSIDAGAGDAGPRGGEDAGATDAGSVDGVDSGTAEDAGPVGMGCPPAGPFGAGVGNVPMDATVTTCDGEEVSLHSLCGGEAAWVFGYADWCPPCRSFARDDVESLWTTYSARGVNALMVVTETSGFGTPTTATCQEIRDRYGLTIPMVIDTDDAIQRALGIDSNAENVVMDGSLRILWNEKYADDEVATELESALGG